MNIIFKRKEVPFKEIKKGEVFLDSRLGNNIAFMKVDFFYDENGADEYNSICLNNGDFVFFQGTEIVTLPNDVSLTI